MKLAPAVLKSVSDQIFRQFPEMRGVTPKVRRQSTERGDTYQVTYQTRATTASGSALDRWVRVTINPNGQILRTSTSR